MFSPSWKGWRHAQADRGRRIVLGVVIAAPPAGADTSKDKAIAKKAVLQRSDLPAGWRDAGKQRSEESGAPECKKFDRESRTVKKIPHADSREFSDSSDPQ